MGKQTSSEFSERRRKLKNTTTYPSPTIFKNKKKFNLSRLLLFFIENFGLLIFFLYVFVMLYIENHLFSPCRRWRLWCTEVHWEAVRANTVDRPNNVPTSTSNWFNLDFVNCKITETNILLHGLKGSKQNHICIYTYIYGES